MKAKAREQRDAAAAQLNKIRAAATNVLEIKNPQARRRAFAILSSVVKSTPAESLAEVRAEAVESAAKHLVFAIDGFGKTVDALYEHAESIRQGGAS